MHPYSFLLLIISFSLFPSRFHCPRTGKCDFTIETQFAVNYVDLGAVVVRLEHFRKSGRTFVLDANKVPHLFGVFGADGYSYEDMARRVGAKTYVVPRILFYHQ